MHGESWTKVRFVVLLFCSLQTESWPRINNQHSESSLNFIFEVVNLDPIVLEKRWTDDESWPNDFDEKMNRGDLR